MNSLSRAMLIVSMLVFTALKATGAIAILDGMPVPVSADGFLTEGRYGDVTLRRAEAGSGPRLVLIDTNSVDRLVFINATFRSNVPILSSFTFNFEHDFDPGPINLVYASAAMSGFFAMTGGGAVSVGNIVRLSSSVQGEPLPTLNHQVVSRATEEFRIPPEPHERRLAGPRKLAGALTFTLDPDETLTFTGPHHARIQVVVPEPGTFSLLIAAGLAIGAWRKIRRA